MVTSTSTPGSIEMEVISFTISEGECRSKMRLWIRISKRSQVLVPSPQGDLRVTILSFLVGRRTGPDTFSFFSTAPFFKSAQTEVTKGTEVAQPVNEGRVGLGLKTHKGLVSSRVKWMHT